MDLHCKALCCQAGLSLRGRALQVLAAGPDDWVHPASRKAKLWVNLTDLQAETHLSDAAVQHIALVCGPRRGTRRACPCHVLAVQGQEEVLELAGAV